jgi:formate dehydrogenase assembly factor FdhD
MSTSARRDDHDAGRRARGLAIGFLRNQRLVTSIEEIVSVHVDWE